MVDYHYSIVTEVAEGGAGGAIYSPITFQEKGQSPNTFLKQISQVVVNCSLQIALMGTNFQE